MQELPVISNIDPTKTKIKKPDWLRVKLPLGESYKHVRGLVDNHKLHTICESGNCPNMGECWGEGTATFMILGNVCTRSCGFCAVATGRPDAVDWDEPQRVAEAIHLMKVKHAVITSVDRDDLLDGGAQHFVDCIRAVRAQSPNIKIEILVPDFRGRLDVAMQILSNAPPDVMNHNLETIPRLYKQARPGSDYQNSLNLLKTFSALYPQVPTKSGLMLGLGETNEEILEVMKDLRAHNVSMLTLGQYLQPSIHHLPVMRYVEPAMFEQLKQEADAMGFNNTASGPMVRSSYHADAQAHQLTD